MILEIEDLHVGYGASHVLEGVSLDINAGESVALLGRNGMGKTTLVRSISGLKPPTITAGSIRLDGHDLLHAPAFKIAEAGIGLVPQGRHVFGSLTVEENLTIVGRRRPRSGEWTVERVYGFFPRLEERARSLSKTLSGGEQQMLAIGRALMTNPKILIMDEPSEGLAPVVLNTIETRLQDLRQTGLSVLVAEQNVDLAIALSDRVLVLGEHGKLSWSGYSAPLVGDLSPIAHYLGI
jgi:branched-chain amino acid transport system ATP-binding protein